MDKKIALEIVLAEVCCSNGNEFCEICPLKNKNCGEIRYSLEDLMLAIKILSSE